MKSIDTTIVWNVSKEKGVHNVQALQNPISFDCEQECTAGAGESDWGNNNRYTLAFIFGELLSEGFTSTESLVEALKQFASIEDCEPWARDMLNGILS